MFTIKFPAQIASAFAHLFDTPNPRNYPHAVLFDAQSRVLVGTTGYLLMIVNTDHVGVMGDNVQNALIPLSMFRNVSELSVADGWAFAPSGEMAPLLTDDAAVLNWRTVYTDPDGGSVALDPEYIGTIMQIHALLGVGKQFLMFSSEGSASIASVGGNMAHIALAPVMTTDNTQLKLTRYPV